MNFLKFNSNVFSSNLNYNSAACFLSHLEIKFKSHYLFSSTWCSTLVCWTECCRSGVRQTLHEIRLNQSDLQTASPFHNTQIPASTHAQAFQFFASYEVIQNYFCCLVYSLFSSDVTCQFFFLSLFLYPLCLKLVFVQDLFPSLLF